MWVQMIDQAVAFRRRLHREPELAWAEERTAGRIREYLTELGVSWRACAETGTVADLAEGAPGRSVALRADIDGLPIWEQSGVEYASEWEGRMHACGHDGHTATLLAAAAWLKEEERALPGRVRLLFQPAEEGGHGARYMIEEGALEGVDAVYGWHNWPGMPVGRVACPDGCVMSANGTFRITVRGLGGHGSQPEVCRDPVLAGAGMVTALQQIVSRRLPPQVAAVVSVTGFEAISTETIIPPRAVLTGSIRFSDDRLRERVHGWMGEIVEGVARAHGVEVELETFSRYGATVNDPGEAERVRSACRRVLGEDCGEGGEPLPVMASEDFSYYLRHRAGAFALVGAGEGASLHSPGYDFNDALIPMVARLLINLAGGRDPEN